MAVYQLLNGVSVEATGTRSGQLYGISFEDTTSAGAVTHATDGVLSSQSSAVAGTSAHTALHTTTGAPTAQAAGIVGSAARSGATISHDTSGTLSGSSAIIVGGALHNIPHATTGALASQQGAVVGSSARGTIAIHDASGALAAAVGSVAGTARFLGKLDLTLALLRNKQVTYQISWPDSAVAGKVVVYNDDGVTPMLSAAIFEDEAGTVPYRGQGIQHRGKFQ